LALLSCRGAEGWISGVGVHPIWRRRGIGRQMIQWIQRVAYRDAFDHLRLEVLEQNGAAILLYEGLGFSKVRELLVLTREPGWVEPIEIARGVAPEQTSHLLLVHQKLHDVDPSWQRDLASLNHRAGRLLGLSLRERQETVGYLIYQPQANAYAILDLAVDPAHPQRLQVAEALLSALHSTQPDFGGHTVNVPADDPLLPAYVAVGYRVWQRQHEMIWPVSEVT
jgi:ribosomal protein S18 acetylase RimI-like enzyme